MGETIDIYTLLFLVLAVVVFLRLRSVLGRRTGAERPPYDPYQAPEGGKGPAGSERPNADHAGPERAGSDRVVTFPRSPSARPDAPREGTAQGEMATRIAAMVPEGSSAHTGLMAIAGKDRSFDPSQFLEGARMAYEMIVTAFAQGDQKTLKMLLSTDVYEGFSQVIIDRERRGDEVESKFVGIDKANLIDASLERNIASITVKFVSQIINAIRDKDGRVIEGDPTKIRDVTDIWTFSRDITSRDPNWRLVATEAAN